MLDSTSRAFWLTAICCFFAIGLSAQTASIPQASTSSGSYTIAGTVVNKLDGGPLARARIIVSNVNDPKIVYSMVTSEDGKFAFKDLPAGKYSLEGAKRRFIPSAYDQHQQFSTAIVTGAGIDTENLMLRLPPVAFITGKILDEVGDPVRNAIVTLYRYDHWQGMAQARRVRTAQTDDQGSYELGPLMPGTFFLSATATPWYAVHPPSWQPEGPPKTASSVDRSLDVAYPLTYYADVTDSDSATPIPVRGGDRIQIDIHLNPVPALHLLVHVPDAGKGAYYIEQLQQSTFEGFTPVQTMSSTMVSSGVVEISGVPPGRYRIRMGGGGPATQMNEIDLTTDGQEIDSSKGEALSKVAVSARVLGEARPPMGVVVGLRSGRSAGVGGEMLDLKGKAELQQVAPGRYELTAWASNKTYWIDRISAQGASVSGRTLTVTPGASASVQLTLVAASAEVHGAVKRQGKPVAGAMVVLVPKNRELNRDLFRRDQSDLDGTFTLHQVVPGSYTLLAIEDGWDLDWSEPGVIAAYLTRGQPVEIGSRAGRVVDISTPVEAQAK